MAQDLAAERAALVDRLRSQGVMSTGTVERALRRVPRERFLAPEWRERAYEDAPLPLGEHQTVSAPHMVAMMTEALAATPGDRVLEVGGGSGYHAAVLAEVVGPEGHVHSVELVPELAEAARERLAAAGYADRVSVHVGDGSLGWPAAAPFDRVSVACAAPRSPEPLLEQVRPGGRLVIPVGSLEGQTLLSLDKEASGEMRERPLAAVRFVPLLGVHGFSGRVR